MKEYKFVFVILHYITIEDTKKCVSSIIENCRKYNYSIVIVDNCSKNQTGEELKELYKNNNDITVIINEKNLGFAKGNNVGFEYAKQNLNPDFIILCNNDTYILDNEFCKEIIKKFEETSFALLGPKIELLDGKINRVVSDEIKLSTVKKELKILKQELKANSNELYNFIYKTKLNIRKNIKKLLIKTNIKKESKEKGINPEEEHINVMLHGCFLIFSKKYIEKFDGLDDRTFLYREEELLTLRIKENNLLTIYDPKVRIKHMEDSSTNAITKTKKEKIRFMNKHKIASTKILIEELEKNIKT